MAFHEITVYGARGSFPVAGQAYLKYGGRTSCFSLETPSGLIIIDAGTGLAALGDLLMMRPSMPPITLLFTHFHLDHITGLPSFKPLLRTDTRLTLMGSPNQAADWQRAVTTLMEEPYWPVSLARCGATVRFEDLSSTGAAGQGSGKMNRFGIDISWCPVLHPQGGVNFRLEMAQGSIVIGSDREHGDNVLDRVFVEFCRGADILIHDAQYTPEEYPGHRGWGHSTWVQAAEVAKQAGVKQLVLTSHDPGHTDAIVDQIISDARHIFPNTQAASEGLCLSFNHPADG